MAAAACGELIDLPGMAAHQRASVVTVIAMLMHILARYGKVDRTSERSWARAWKELIGLDALRVTAPHEPAHKCWCHGSRAGASLRAL